jgi:hypothetical protein
MLFGINLLALCEEDDSFDIGAAQPNDHENSGEDDDAEGTVEESRAESKAKRVKEHIQHMLRTNNATIHQVLCRGHVLKLVIEQSAALSISQVP